MKFKAALITSYLALVSIIVLGLYFVFNNNFNANFQKYVINRQDEMNLEIVEKIKKSYGEKNSFNIEEIEHIGISAIDMGIILKLEDINGTIIFNALTHNSGKCKEMLEIMASEMAKFHKNETSKYKEVLYELDVNGINFGNLTIGYYGPYYYSDLDISYLESMNNSFLIIAISSFVAAIILGLIFSEKISNQLKKIINASKELYNNNYSKRVITNTNIIEFKDLVNQFNDLSKKLENEKSLRDQLSSDIAHELRTPLAIITGYIEAIIDGVYKADEATLSNLNEEIKRLTLLVEKLDRVDKYNSLKLEKVNFKNIITKHVENCRKNIDDKKINVSTNLKNIELLADKEKINSLVINLLSNAIKYSNNEGSININLTSKKNNVIFKISNSGSTISEDDQAKIFERFYRVDNSRTKETGGQGIGLSIVKDIVIAHGGSVTVTSENNITTFTVSIPQISD